MLNKNSTKLGADSLCLKNFHISYRGIFLVFIRVCKLLACYVKLQHIADTKNKFLLRAVFVIEC